MLCVIVAVQAMNSVPFAISARSSWRRPYDGQKSWHLHKSIVHEVMSGVIFTNFFNPYHLETQWAWSMMTATTLLDSVKLPSISHTARLQGHKTTACPFAGLPHSPVGSDFPLHKQQQLTRLKLSHPYFSSSELGRSWEKWEEILRQLYYQPCLSSCTSKRNGSNS